MKEYDIVIFGAGSGGYEAMLHAKRYGMHVAMIDISEKTIGGNCLNRGCIPSKYMRFGAKLREHLSRGIKYGIKINSQDIDWLAFKEHRDNAVSDIRESFKAYAKSLKIDIYYGKGRFKDNNTIETTKEDVIKGKYILLSTGSSVVSILHYDKTKFKIYNTDTIWGITEKPKSVLIVGAGVVGVEFAYIFRMYDIDVYLVDISKRIIPSESEDSASYLSKKLKSLGVKIFTSNTIENLIEEDGKRKAILKDGTIIEYDIILEAVGRAPNTKDIGIENTDIALTEKGYVKIDEYAKTSVNHIYACGDVTSPLMLAHKSMYEGRTAVAHINNDAEKLDYKLVPKIIYSAYEIASFGINIDQAEDMELDYEVGTATFAKNPKAIIDDEAEGYAKVIYDANTKEILGAEILGPQAGELIHQVVHIVKAGKDVEFLSRCMYTHPSLSETVVTSSQKKLL
ncbi:pyridine nucleotide-disulphide oxidoreductase dimerisation region [Hydrogenobaculum sp. Y04AAS1]|uniref:FAD-dependent oxidoreductase n=1 Tax=Hydrogenobaculum sp. (strain Y04AAS1) TaxID=380749 RepID=UPI00015BD987|nr:pyridine nucleotide-disulphide oxidoreductase dimerisation region [Hydrogenobaculum sp. Y04AAS1]HCT66582.1 NAD(P)/FAD-dependent oxidoreductase [Hydrogenobaculum sp.]